MNVIILYQEQINFEKILSSIKVGKFKLNIRFNFSKLQKLPSVHEQFPPIGVTHDVSQSHDVNKGTKGDDKKKKKDDDNDDDGLYMLLFGPDKRGKYEPRYSDEKVTKFLISHLENSRTRKSLQNLYT